MTIHFRSNSPSHRWLSNLWSCRIEFDGYAYESAEHLYQALKTEPENRAVFRGITPVEAKSLGRHVPLRSDFEPLEAMKLVLDVKFSDPELRRLLLETGDEELVEDNPGPWGGRDGGANQLGELLMRLRDQIHGS